MTPRPDRTQIAIVGAGPAGMSAAIAAARRGARVVVLDEAPRTGGQIFRQPPAGVRARTPAKLVAPSHTAGHELIDRIAEADVEVVHGAQVFSVEPGVLDYEIEGRHGALRFDALILAPGAYDRSLAFPGWTLPGVITAGAAQVMVRGFQVAPGTRALIAGTGPLLLPTVTALLAAGVEIVAALEACGRWRALRTLPSIARNGKRRREAWHYLRAMFSFRVPYRQGWTILEALGDERVERARIARVDGGGRPKAGTEREVDVDVVCTGWGLLPSIELACLLGCELRRDAVRGGWVVQHDDDQRSSVEAVWVAGEIAGIGGAEVAAVEGRIAGIAAARAVGRAGADDAPELARLRRERAAERRASDALLGAFSLDALPGLQQIATAATTACRCEDVTLGQVQEAAGLFGADLRSVKMATRAGMGPCQGRICQSVIADALQHRCGAAPPPSPVVQRPVKPISVETAIAACRDRAAPDPD